MAGLKQRRNAPLVQVSTDEIKNRDASTADPTNSDEASSTGGSEDASLSTNNDNNTKQLGGKKSSNESLDSLNDTGKMRSLKDRSYIPNSFYIILGTIIGLEYFSGMYCMSTIESYKNTITNSVIAIRNMMTYTKDLSMTIFDDKDSTAAIRIDSNGVTNLTMEYAKVGIIISFCVSLFYIFFLAPFRAGFWTGPRTRKAKLHRYMGLLYLVHYVLAWVEFCTNYDPYRPSYLCHFIAVNGT